MTAAEPGAAAPPPRDSALEAMGFAFGVLRKPGFLWPPILLGAIMFLPLVLLPPMPPPPAVGASRAAIDAYVNDFFEPFIPAVVVFTIMIIVIGPLAGAVINRLGLQYVEGEPPRPFAPGIANLAWRYFLQTLAFFLLTALGILAVVLLGALSSAILGAGAGILVTIILGGVLVVVVALRLGLAPILLLWGAGPIEAIDTSWALTRGHLGRVFRWFVVIGVLVSLLSTVASTVVSELFTGLGLALVGVPAGGVVAAPFGIMQAIGLVQLTRLLQNPIQPGRTAPPLPAWMSPTDPPRSEPPTAPPDERAE
jgi:hypothetical protein